MNPEDEKRVEAVTQAITESDFDRALRELTDRFEFVLAAGAVGAHGEEGD